MKRLIILIYCFFFASNLFSQINIGKSKSSINLYVSEHEKEVFEDLKKTTTYFVVPEDLNLSVEEVGNVIGEIWTFNEIKFISEDEFKSNKNDYYSGDKSIIKLVDNYYVKKVKFSNNSDRAGDVKSQYIEYKLILINYVKNKKGQIYPKTIAEIFFTPNIRLIRDFVHSSGAMNPLVLAMMNYKKLNKKNPEKPGYYNFNLGYIKNYLQTLNTRLNKFKNLKIRDGIENKKKLRELKNQVLYTPDWILRKVDPMKSIYKETFTPEKQFKGYKFKYKVLSNDELNNKILNKEDIYYLMYTRFNQVKILSIINSLSGEIIYLNEENSHNVKSKDLKEISKLIE